MLYYRLPDSIHTNYKHGYIFVKSYIDCIWSKTTNQMSGVDESGLVEMPSVRKLGSLHLKAGIQFETSFHCFMFNYLDFLPVFTFADVQKPFKTLKEKKKKLWRNLFSSTLWPRNIFLFCKQMCVTFALICAYNLLRKRFIFFLAEIYRSEYLCLCHFQISWLVMTKQEIVFYL